MPYDEATPEENALQMLREAMPIAIAGLKKSTSGNKPMIEQVRDATNRLLRAQYEVLIFKYNNWTGNVDEFLALDVEIAAKKRAIEYLYKDGDQSVFSYVFEEQAMNGRMKVEKTIFDYLVLHHAAGMMSDKDMKSRVVEEVRDKCKDVMLAQNTGGVDKLYEEGLQNVEFLMNVIEGAISQRLVALAQEQGDIVSKKEQIKNELFESLRVEVMNAHPLFKDNIKDIMDNPNCYRRLFDKGFEEAISPPKLANSAILSPGQETVVRHLEQSAADMRSNPSGFAAILKSLSDFIKNFTGIDLPSVSFKSKLQKTVGRAPEQGQTPSSNAPSGADANANANAENDNIPPTHGL